MDANIVVGTRVIVEAATHRLKATALSGLHPRLVSCARTCGLERMAPKPRRPPAAAGTESKTAAGCSSDDLNQGELKSLKARRAQAESRPHVASTSLSVAGMVLAFGIGWGGRGMRADDAAQSDAPDVWEHTTHPGIGVEGFNWTQLSMSRR